MWAGIIFRFGTPVSGRKEPSRPENHDRVNEQCNHREFHLATADFSTQILWGSTNHLTCNENTDDQKQQQVDHAHALATKDAVQPHPNHRRESGYRIEAIVLTIRSEEHTSELQSHSDLVCRLLLEKKKKNK